jgi:hypothetical protein
VRRVSGRLFYRLIYVFTFLIGLKLIFDARAARSEADLSRRRG